MIFQFFLFFSIQNLLNCSSALKYINPQELQWILQKLLHQLSTIITIIPHRPYTINPRFTNHSLHSLLSPLPPCSTLIVSIFSLTSSSFLLYPPYISNFILEIVQRPSPIPIIILFATIFQYRFYCLFVPATPSTFSFLPLFPKFCRSLLVTASKPDNYLYLVPRPSTFQILISIIISFHTFCT